MIAFRFAMELLPKKLMPICFGVVLARKVQDDLLTYRAWWTVVSISHFCRFNCFLLWKRTLLAFNGDDSYVLQCVLRRCKKILAVGFERTEHDEHLTVVNTSHFCRLNCLLLWKKTFLTFNGDDSYVSQCVLRRCRKIGFEPCMDFHCLSACLQSSTHITIDYY